PPEVEGPAAAGCSELERDGDYFLPGSMSANALRGNASPTLVNAQVRALPHLQYRLMNRGATRWPGAAAASLTGRCQGTKLTHGLELGDVDPSRPVLTEGLSDESLQEINRLWTIVRAFSNAAHDVNNALQVIAGSAELVEARELDPACRRRVESIRVQAGRAAAAIEQLALYSRDAPESPGVIDLAPLVEAAVSMRGFALARARIGVTVERSDGDPYWVAVERNRTMQALLDVLLSAEASVRSRRHSRIAVLL